MRPPTHRRTRRVGRRLARPLALVLASLHLCACAGGAAKEPAPAPRNAATVVVSRLHDAMIEVMKQGPELSYRQRYEQLEDVARSCFDIPFMAALSLGESWRELDAAQRATWLERYERFHISSVADFRVEYVGQSWRILGSSIEPNGWWRVNAYLDYPGRNVDLHADYLLRQLPQGWRIVDVRQPPTVSEIAMRRSEYGAVLKERGFDELIALMDRRIADRELED